MRNINKVASLSLATFGLFFSLTASADLFGLDNAPDESIQSCVTEIGGYADYSGSDHVRHEVETTGRRSLAYKVRLSTKVFSETDGELIREYTTKCIVYGDSKPVFFKIEESDSGA